MMLYSISSEVTPETGVRPTVFCVAQWSLSVWRLTVVIGLYNPGWNQAQGQLEICVFLLAHATVLAHTGSMYTYIS